MQQLKDFLFKQLGCENIQTLEHTTLKTKVFIIDSTRLSQALANSFDVDSTSIVVEFTTTGVKGAAGVLNVYVEEECKQFTVVVDDDHDYCITSTMPEDIELIEMPSFAKFLPKNGSVDLAVSELTDFISKMFQLQRMRKEPVEV